MSTASRGAARENAIKRKLEAEGWVCVRAAASKGAVDIWALRGMSRWNGAEHLENALKKRFGLRHDRYDGAGVLALQIKANKGNPWMNFRKAEREELRILSEQAGAKPFLIHWPPHGKERWYPPEEWPETPRK